MIKPDLVHVVTTNNFAGVERYVCTTSNELADRGWKVAVVGGSSQLMPEQLRSEVAYFPGATSPAAVLRLLSMPRSRLVHAHMTAAEASAYLAGKLRGHRVLATRHFAQVRGSSLAGRILARSITRSLNSQIAISHFVAKEIQEDSQVVYNGVPAAKATADPESQTVLVMQRHEPEKRTDLALRAWQAAGLGTRGWRLRMLGKGSQSGELERLARALQITESVEFAGFVADPRIELAKASTFLATAPREPFGLAVVEAMAHGLAVAAADGGAHPETVGDAGVLFPVDDVRACAQALCRLADSSPLRRELGVKAQRRHHDLFSVQRHVDALEKIYVAALAAGPGGQA